MDYNKKEEANNLFNISIKLNLNPNDSISFYNKSFSFCGLEQYKEAIECLDSAINLDRNYTEAYNRKDLALDDLKRHQEAIECYNKAIELNPNYSFVYNGIYVSR